MSDTKYNVVLSNILSSEMDRSQVVDNLSALFKSNNQKIEQLLGKPETIIKKDVDKATAEKYHAAITQAGAACSLVEVEAESEADLPDIKNDIPDAESRPPVAEHLDPTQRNMSALTSANNTQLSLEQKKLNETLAKQQVSEHSSGSIEERLCPECGTIRSDADSTCLHCGYDPVAIRKAANSSRIKKVALISVLTLALVLGIGIPAFNYVSEKMKLDKDFLLVFDTRNQITNVINSTNFWPNQNIDANLPETISNDSIESIVVGTNSVMTITIRGSITGGQSQTIIFKPKALKGKIVWNCSKGTLAKNLRPDVCQ